MKSGYHPAVSCADSDVASSSNSATNKRWWSSIWNLHLPSKLKIFCWKACQGILPTMFGLHKRNISKSPFCPRCRKAVETVSHALVYCKRAKQVWKNSDWGVKLLDNNLVDFDTILHSFLCNFSMSNIENFVVISWAIWFVRNSFVHTGVSISALETFERGSRMLDSREMFSSATNRYSSTAYSKVAFSSTQHVKAQRGRFRSQLG